MVLIVVASVLVVILYYFIFRFRVKSIAQYLWLITCGGVYAFFTLNLSEHPEEAIHFLEYGLLTYFVFNALSHSVRDWTVYISTVCIVSFIGITDEFIQWLLPTRVWDYKDIGLNALAGGIFVLAIWKAIRPGFIDKPVQKDSVKILLSILTIVLTYLGICLSNTPDRVHGYTNSVKTLEWLRNEEVMTEFGHKHRDPEIGIFFSRFSKKDLRDFDIRHGGEYGSDLSEEYKEKSREEILNVYNVNANPFMHEFIVHVSRRDNYLDEYELTDFEKDKIELSSFALRENTILQKYFSNTLKTAGLAWPEHKVLTLAKTAKQWEGTYTSETGRLITSFDLKTALISIFLFVLLSWLVGISFFHFNKKHQK